MWYIGYRYMAYIQYRYVMMVPMCAKKLVFISGFNGCGKTNHQQQLLNCETVAALMKHLSLYDMVYHIYCTFRYIQNTSAAGQKLTSQKTKENPHTKKKKETLYLYTIYGFSKKYQRIHVPSVIFVDDS